MAERNPNLAGQVGRVPFVSGGEQITTGQIVGQGVENLAKVGLEVQSQVQQGNLQEELLQEQECCRKKRLHQRERR